MNEHTLWPQLQEITLCRDACLYALTVPHGAASLLSWIKWREEAGMPLQSLRLKAYIYDEDRAGFEAAKETWGKIRAVVKVIDEWSIKVGTGVRREWALWAQNVT